jgi:tetratricopeptide (TPR) repeat protein
MSFLMQRQNRPAEALVFLREAFGVSSVVLGEDYPDRLVLLINMGSLSTQLEQPEDAESYFKDAIERVRRTLGEDHPYFLPPVQSLGDLLVKQQRFAEAVELLSGAETACRKKAAIRDDGALGRLLLNLGIARSAMLDLQAAEANLIEAHALLLERTGPTSSRVRQGASALVALYTAWLAAEPDAGYEAKIAEWSQKLQDATPPAVPDENR